MQLSPLNYTIEERLVFLRLTQRDETSPRGGGGGGFVGRWAGDGIKEFFCTLMSLFTQKTIESEQASEKLNCSCKQFMLVACGN